MTPTTSLPAIAALARAGALERAWGVFVAGGHDRREGDAAALALKGRLLKGRARAGAQVMAADVMAADQRAALCGEAAAAYAAANAIEPAPYHAINAASLLLLAGDPAGAARQARAVLAMLDAPGPPADTPYYLAATRAEALLLLGDEAGAQAAMASAARADPDGWADRASTMAQLEEIAAALPLALPWLDSFRPPASLHFAGHMGLASGGAAEALLTVRVDALIAQHRIGFAWGCAAAGCDIVIGERVLAAGGELALILPAPQDLFEQQSVAPAGAAWTARYRALLARAASVVAVGDAAADGFDPSLHDPLATELAGRMAIGEAVLNARRLASRCFQAVALDHDGGGPHSAGLAALWPDRATSCELEVAREVAVGGLFAGDIAEPARQLAAMLRIRLAGPGATSKAIRDASRAVWQALSGLAPERIGADAGGWDVLVDDPAEAARLALTVLASCDAADLSPPTIGLAFGVACIVRDEATHRLVPHGTLGDETEVLSAMAQTGTALASNAFALALTVQGLPGARCELSHHGEGGPGDAVYMVLAEACHVSAH